MSNFTIIFNTPKLVYSKLIFSLCKWKKFVLKKQSVGVRVKLPPSPAPDATLPFYAYIIYSEILYKPYMRLSTQSDNGSWIDVYGLLPTCLYIFRNDVFSLVLWSPALWLVSQIVEQGIFGQAYDLNPPPPPDPHNYTCTYK